jgi:drug/metabolite transporter (DMT)-like permease
MLVTAGLVATSFTVGKAIANGMDPTVLTFIRFCCAVLFFFPYVHRKYSLDIPSVSALLRYSIISLSLVGFFILMFISLQYTSALNTGVIFTLVPGISGLYSLILLRERLGKYRLAALIMAMIGAIWVLFNGDLERMQAMQLNRGDIIFLGGCLLMALYTPLVKLFYRGEPMAIMTFWILVTGCGWLFLPAVPKLIATDWSSIEPMVWGGIFYLAVFCTIITFFLSQWSTLYLGPTRVMAYSYLYPPFILGIDWIFGHGLPSAKTLPGVVLIGLAMFIVQRGAVEEGKEK